MPIQLIDNFELSVPKPIDNRIVVGAGFTYTDRNSIPLPYVGMRVYDVNDSTPYVYTGATWSFDVSKVAITEDLSSSSLHYIPFVFGTSSVQTMKSSGTRLRFQPSTGRLQFADGSATNPTLSFVGTGTKFVGIYRPNTTSLAISVNDAKLFEVGASGITASQRFFVKGSSVVSSGRGDGTVVFASSTGQIGYDFYIYSNSTGMKFYPLGSATPNDDSISISNYHTSPPFNLGYSEFVVRDQHYINAKSNTGILELGNAGSNGQFTFFMNGHNTFTTGGSFDYDGGGLIIQRNLSVSGASRLSGTVSILSNAFMNSNTLYLKSYPYGGESIPPAPFDPMEDDESYIKYATDHAGYTIDGALISGRTNGALGTTEAVVGRGLTDNQVALHWSYQGNVGIGTSSVANNRLRIASSNTSSGSNTLRVISNTGLDYFVVRNDGYSSFGASSVTGVRLNIAGDSTVSNYGLRVLSSTGSFNFGVRNDGNVGIGTQPDGVYVLKIAGAGATGSILVTTKNWVSGASSSIFFGDSNHYISSNYGGQFKISSLDPIRIMSGVGATDNLRTRIYVDTSGDIGIGTTTPASKLTVVGEITASGGDSSSPGLSFWQYPNSGVSNGDAQWTCPDPETKILLENMMTKRAGDLKIGDYVHTMHETTGEWSNYRVNKVEFYTSNKLEIKFTENSTIKVSNSHKFLDIDGNWIVAESLVVGCKLKTIDGFKVVESKVDIGTGQVVKLEIDQAHTYISEGLISHNKVINDVSNVVALHQAGTTPMVLSGGKVLIGNVAGTGLPFVGTNYTSDHILHIGGVMRLEPLASTPISADPGDMYFDSTSLKLRVWDGYIWNDCF